MKLTVPPPEYQNLRSVFYFYRSLSIKELIFKNLMILQKKGILAKYVTKNAMYLQITFYKK